MPQGRRPPRDGPGSRDALLTPYPHAPTWSLWDHFGVDFYQLQHWALATGSPVWPTITLGTWATPWGRTPGMLLLTLLEPASLGKEGANFPF